MPPMPEDKELRKKYGPEYRKKIDFFQQIAAPAVVAGEKLGMDPKLLMSQAALESAWGKSELAQKAKNFGGVKALGDQPYVEMDSAEGYGKNRRVEKSKFAAYPSVDAFFQEWPKKFSMPRYAQAIKEKTPGGYARGLGKAKYYTENPDKYAALMEGIYRDFERMMSDKTLVKPTPPASPIVSVELQ